jgi:hypothetical protein
MSKNKSQEQEASVTIDTSKKGQVKVKAHTRRGGNTKVKAHERGVPFGKKGEKIDETPKEVQSK